MCRHLPEIGVRLCRGRGAFTLIELLVVISVISLLMGILLPVINKSRAMAVSTTCRANLRSIGVCLRTYLDDYRDIMPPACEYPWLITDPNAAGYKPPITKFLGPLLHEPEVFVCRADTKEKYYLMGDGGTSYKYRERLGGTTISTSFLAQRGIKERNIDVMSDFDPFHGTAGRPGAENYLYADWHVGDLKNQD